MGREGAHILVVPCSLQGHINPMLQFSKRLASKGLKVTLVIITTAHSEPIQTRLPDNSVKIELVSDGVDEGYNTATTMEAYFERFDVEFPKNLSKLIQNLSESDFPVSALVYDSLMSCLLEVAHSFGLKGASFFTQSAAVSAIYRHVYEGTLKLPLENSNITLPSLPAMGIEDMPTLISHHMGFYQQILKLVVDNQSSGFGKADWLFANTFDKLETEVVKWLASQWPIKTIGPAVPSLYLDKRLEEDNKDHGISLFKPEVESCIDWLDTKETNSVVYVSFGSMASLDEGQMEELAMGLKESSHSFLWVVRSSETSKLPSDFMDRVATTERILIVNWSPQLEVLAHRAVGCFMTHCGWNSTLEALSLGVPMLVLPQWTDQITNAKYVVDVWGAGVRVKVDEKGVARREEIAICVQTMMEGESGMEIRKNVARWKEMAREAVDEGGSSDKNIEDFIAELAY